MRLSNKVNLSPHENILVLGTTSLPSEPELHYAVVMDAGSSGTRAYLYTWPQHTGDPHQLLKISPLLQVSFLNQIYNIDKPMTCKICNENFLFSNHFIALYFLKGDCNKILVEAIILCK